MLTRNRHCAAFWGCASAIGTSMLMAAVGIGGRDVAWAGPARHTAPQSIAQPVKPAEPAHKDPEPLKPPAKHPDPPKPGAPPVAAVVKASPPKQDEPKPAGKVPGPKDAAPKAGPTIAAPKPAHVEVPHAAAKETAARPHEEPKTVHKEAAPKAAHQEAEPNRKLDGPGRSKDIDAKERLKAEAARLLKEPKATEDKKVGSDPKLAHQQKDGNQHAGKDQPLKGHDKKDDGKDHAKGGDAKLAHQKKEEKHAANDQPPKTNDQPPKAHDRAEIDKGHSKEDTKPAHSKDGDKHTDKEQSPKGHGKKDDDKVEPKRGGARLAHHEKDDGKEAMKEKAATPAPVAASPAPQAAGTSSPVPAKPPAVPATVVLPAHIETIVGPVAAATPNTIAAAAAGTDAKVGADARSVAAAVATEVKAVEAGGADAANQGASLIEAPMRLGAGQQASSSGADDKTDALRSLVADPAARVMPADPAARVAKASDKKQGGSARAVFGAGLPPPPSVYRPNELLISNLQPEQRDVLVSRGYRVAPSVGGVAKVTLPENSTLSVWDVQNALRGEFDNNSVGLNYIYKPYHSATSDKPAQDGEGIPICTRELCYGPGLIKWNEKVLPACAAGVKIGVIDTSIDRKHPAFEGRDITTISVAESSPWHGTGVLSVMAGEAKSKTPGLIPDATFIAVAAFAGGPSDKTETDTERLLRALDELAKHKVQIVNMSFVGPKDDMMHNRIIDMATKHGVVFVAAAGNGGVTPTESYPAAYKEVIAVTAVDARGGTYDHASRGEFVDAAAPGVRIWAAVPNGKAGFLSGTSLAAPFVTAVVAAIYKESPLQKGSGPFDPKGVMLARLFDKSAHERRNPTRGLGLIRAPSTCGGKEPSMEWAPAISAAPTARTPPHPVLGGWRTSISNVALPVGAR